MKLSAPTQMVFIIAVVLAVLGLLAMLVQIPVLTGLASWLVLLGFIVLAVGNIAPGL